ncbi:peptidoglycan DD-metalloendopeptidase family protein [Herbiconiux sp. YIM B11900]|uniref:M23 family metallopeptidase n=1 Tax=Herbiconiux sp. YIM B11900 TaxID=3404131 RepID=UPI003F870C2A
MTRARHKVNSLLGALAVAIAVIVSGAASAAAAAEYPSWEDVLAAQANESIKQNEIANIQSLISGLTADVIAAQERSIQLGTEYQIAQDNFDTALFRAEQLRSQADAAQAVANTSSRQAGQFAALLARSGDSGLSMALLLSKSSDADNLLYQLGTMSKITESSSQVYRQATRDKNTAASLADQATVAAAIRESLAQEATLLRDEAIAAQQAVEDALSAQQAYQADLEAQLAVLTENRAATEVDYNAGVAARAAAEAAASAARSAAAAEAAAAAATAGQPVATASGWFSPFPGAFSTDEYGMRVNPVDGGYRLHAGLDLAYNGGTCGAPVYAAAAGQVTFAGPNGGLGNNVQIGHGGGVTTSYAHNTTVIVGRGEAVVAGQVVAYAGTTGNSTGCHLHFETRVSGDPQDPRAFMAARGVAFG